MKTTVEENKLIQLEDISAEMLPELQGWREKQLQIVKDHPFVAIVDIKTYEEAKKNRTALVTARTTIEKQEKLIASKLKDFRSKVGEASKELIQITEPHEIAQQDEVKIHEAKKEAERFEKERLEKERKDAIMKSINDWISEWTIKTDQLLFNNIESFKSDFDKAVEIQYDTVMEELELVYSGRLDMLKGQIEHKIDFITKEENTRLEREKLEAERKAFELQQKEAREKAEKEEAERKAKIETEEAERKAKLQKEKDARKAIEAKERATREAEENRIREQQKIEADKLAKERAELEAEKQRIADEKAKEQAVIEAKKQAEIKAKEVAEAKKRAAALKPDKDKLTAFIDSLVFTQELPELIDESSKDHLNTIVHEFRAIKKSFHSKVNSIN